MSQAEAPAAHYSPDGRWRWDGSAWVPAAGGYGSLSPDGMWWWDGTQWVPIPAAPAAAAPGRPFMSGRGRALFLCACLALFAIVMVVGIINDGVLVLRIESLDVGERLSRGDLRTWDAFTNLMAWPLRVVTAMSLIALPLWLYRAAANLAPLGAVELRFRPLLGALTVFIPLANLVLVLLFVREIYKASEPDLEPNNRATRAGVSVWRGVWVWWCSLIVSLVLSFVGGVLAIFIPEFTLDVLDLALWYAILNGVAQLIWALAGILVVLGIDWRQCERYARLTSGAPALH